MTRTTNARVAGFTFLFYIAAGVTQMVLFGKATRAAGTGAGAPDAPAASALGTFLLSVPGGGSGAELFAVGSTLFCYLLLRGRIVPVALALLGVLASVLLVVLLPAQLAGFLSGPVTGFMWIPMALFEVTLALWLLIKGAAMPARTQSV